LLNELKALMVQVGGIRRTGSAAIDLAWVAAGRFDGYIEHGLEAWDMAAGMLLVREAGGYATDADGGPAMAAGTGTIVAANQAVHKALLELLADTRREPVIADVSAGG
jgi:myo-inositol-1(or 4)-monophosphatase